MQDYNINVNYNYSQDVRKTNYKMSKLEEPRTKVQDSGGKRQMSLFSKPQKAIGVGIGLASKINGYVGVLTENTIQQRNISTALTYAGMGVLALSNPAAGAMAMAVYTADKIISYQITQYKANLSADFMRTLSGGVYTIGK